MLFSINFDSDLFFDVDAVITSTMHDAASHSDDIPVSSIHELVDKISQLFSAYASQNDGYEFRTSANTYQHGSGETDHVEICKIVQIPCTSRLNSDGETNMITKNIAKIKLEYCTYPRRGRTDEMRITLKLDTDTARFSAIYDHISTSEKFKIRSQNILCHCVSALTD